jgi:hypothetical protein
MRLLATFFLLAILVGCQPKVPAKCWNLQHKAMTQEEVERVDAHVREVLSHIPQQVSGHDQDLDDYAKAVYYGAINSLTKPRMFEQICINEWWQETGV